MVPRWFSEMWVPELLFPSKIIKMFGQKTAFFAQKYAFLGTYIGLASSFIAPLVGWLVVVVHGLYLATGRHNLRSFLAANSTQNYFLI